MCSYSGKRKCNSKTVALIPEARAMCVDVRAVDTETRIQGRKRVRERAVDEKFWEPAQRRE